MAARPLDGSTPFGLGKAARWIGGADRVRPHPVREISRCAQPGYVCCVLLRERMFARARSSASASACLEHAGACERACVRCVRARASYGRLIWNSPDAAEFIFPQRVRTRLPAAGASLFACVDCEWVYVRAAAAAAPAPAICAGGLLHESPIFPLARSHARALACARIEQRPLLAVSGAAPCSTLPSARPLTRPTYACRF